MDVIAIRRSERTDEHIGILTAMHCVRSNVFHARLGWNVEIVDGQEHDQYDALDPTYIVVLSNGSQVVGCARLLATTGPTMLSNTFPELLSKGAYKPHAGMVESSRFCVDTTNKEGRGQRLLHEATLSLFAGIVEWCLLHGFTEIATATDVRFERILRRAGWPMLRLGVPRQINETLSVAGVLPANRASFDQLRPPNYRSHLKSTAHIAA